MSTSGNSSKPKKGSRVSGVQLHPSRFMVVRDMLKRADVLSRMGLCFLAAVAMLLISLGWERPQTYSLGDVPERSITARVAFEKLNPQKTKRLKDEAGQKANAVYRHDRATIEQLAHQFEDRVKQIANADPEAPMDEPMKDSWKDFMLGLSASEGEDSSNETSKEFYENFAEFKGLLKEEADLTEFVSKVKSCLAPISERGILLKGLQHSIDEEGGNQAQIVIVAGDSLGILTPVKSVRDEALPNFQADLKRNLPETFSRHTFAWFQGKLSDTLTHDAVLSQAEAKRKADEVGDQVDPYDVGAVLATGGKPIGSEELALLEQEAHEASLAEPVAMKLARTGAHFGMYATVFALCGFYSLLRKSKVLLSTPTLSRVLGASVVTFLLCKLASFSSTELIIIPLLLYSMTIVIAYKQELALLLSVCMAVVVTVALGLGTHEFTTYAVAMATSVLCLQHIRNRTKLIYVGLTIGVVAFGTAIGASTLTHSLVDYRLLMSATWYGFFSLVAGMLMSASLPCIEWVFDVQTELKLLEWADISQPLLQELVRRAPGTYNHTINVASFAEAAAEAIGANGLLVRVGAYFHDIGKMLKPGYFIENQTDGANRHESLLPAMSTLVIIAHVKDGADLARQHGLPNVLVDFIMQHHGTTLVEYFYNRANEQSESDPDGMEVDEHSFRYPGPKPQTKETAVLMLADTVESATRSLVDPTPSRIESLVHDLAMKKLMDGQFDECGLTLSDLKKVEVSLIKSVSAVYHSRIKYPDQQSA